MITSLNRAIGAPLSSVARNAASVPFLAAVLIVILSGWQLGKGYRAAKIQADQDVRYLSRSLAEHIERSVDTIAIVLDGTVERLEHGALHDPARLKAFLERRAAAVKQLDALVILDASGKWIMAGGIKAEAGNNSVNEQFFKTHAGADDRRLQIGTPILERIGGSVMIPLSRRWNTPDGKFGGVALAFLDPKYFEEFYRRIGLGQKGSVSLLTERGHLLLNHSSAPVLSDLDISSRPFFKEALIGREGLIGPTRPLDGTNRIASFDHLSEYPLIVVAEDNVAEALNAWRREAMGECIALCLAVTLLIALGVASVRRQDRQRKVEASIRASESRYRLLTENSTDMISIKPTFGGVRSYVSPACRNVVGWEPEEFAKLTAEEFIHPDDFDGLRARYKKLGAENTELVDIHRGRHKDGRWLWLETTFRLVGAGSPGEHVIATGRDITTRRESDDRLAGSEARFRMLAENTTDLILLADFNGACRYVSPASLHILGYEPSDLVGVDPISLIHPDELQDTKDLLARLATGDDNRGQLTYRLRRKDETYVWVETQLQAIRASAGQPAAVVSAIRDVSDRHAKAEELRIAKDEAVRANAAKTDFLANMSHEIRTPLNSIIGWTDLLLKDHRENPELARRLTLIQASGGALLTVVNDILDFSKIEAGQIELDIRPFSPRVLVENIASMLAGPANDKSVAIARQIDEAAPDYLLGDESRLRQVLLNLMNNAIKFTPIGKITIGLVIDSFSETDSLLRFVVKDDGIGISEAHQKHLFERFTQADGTITRRFGGTGLGLAICKQLVALMGGTIGVDSREGKGATFWFQLRLSVVKSADTPVPVVVEDPIDHANAFHLLLVEDVIVNQDLAKAFLERWGHKVDVASDGAEALQMIHLNLYDLVFMDVQMPIMDGITATKILRNSDHPHASVPIVAMTANVLPHQVAVLLASGMDDHVGKPFKGRDLQTAIARWANQNRAKAFAS